MGIPENCEQLKPEDNWGQGQEAWLQLWERTGLKPGATFRQGGLTAINPAQDTEPGLGREYNSERSIFLILKKC